MSWLLVALIPGLLMLATFGLDRLESSLTGCTLSESEVVAFLAQAGTNGPDATPPVAAARPMLRELIDASSTG